MEEGSKERKEESFTKPHNTTATINTGSQRAT